MNMFKNFIKSYKKSKRLQKVSIELSKPVDYNNMFNLVNSKAIKEKHLDEMVKICYSDELNKIVLIRYGVDNDILKSVYEKLILNGAGQFVKGHFVCVSSLVYPTTLMFIFQHYRNGGFCVKDLDDYESTLLIVYRLIKFFETNELSELKIH